MAADDPANDEGLRARIAILRQEHQDLADADRAMFTAKKAKRA